MPPKAAWVAAVQGGLVERSGGPSSPFAALSLTRFHGHTYLRGAFTAYRSTLQQVDAALPSTYYIGSIGAGGNFANWVADAHVSYGRQLYGKVVTALGARSSDFDSTGYVSTGLRAGRVFEPSPQFYLTPTISAEFAQTKSLRHSLNAGRPIEFELPEKAWTGAFTVRADRTFGQDRQSFVGLAVSHYVTDNGLTLSQFTDPSRPTGIATPDSWEQVDLSATLHVNRLIWLDGQLQRSFGAVAGDSSTISLGLRMQL